MSAFETEWLSHMLMGTFAKYGFEITKEQADKAAEKVADAVIHSAMAGNPRDWCLTCGTVSGNGECHCTEGDEIEDCNRKAVNFFDAYKDMMEKQVADLRAKISELTPAPTPGEP